MPCRTGSQAARTGRWGAIKEVIFKAPDLPDERDASLEVLGEVKEDVLSDDAAEEDPDATSNE